MSDLLRDVSTEKRWFTILPNIIFEKGLPPIEFQLYSWYKRVAGDEGSCYYSSKHIAGQMGCSKSTIIAARQHLEKLGLIRTGKRRVASGQEVTEVIVVDIWPENMQRFIQTQGVGERTPSNSEGVGERTPGGQGTYPKGSGSVPKEEPVKNNQKEEDDDSDAVIFSTALDNSLIKPSEIGKQMVADALDEYGPERVMAAMKEAVAHNARSWRYVEKVLDGNGRSRDGGPAMDDDWREANEEKIDAMLAQGKG